MKILDREIPYGSRDPRSLRLTQAEADAMIADGFLFEVYDKGTLEFRLSPTYEFGRDETKGIWLVRQIVA